MGLVYDAHRALENAESDVKMIMRKGLRKKKNLKREEYLKILKQMVNFDRHLMEHLGEEEEFIEPLAMM